MPASSGWDDGWDDYPPRRSAPGQAEPTRPWPTPGGPGGGYVPGSERPQPIASRPAFDDRSYLPGRRAEWSASLPGVPRSSRSGQTPAWNGGPLRAPSGGAYRSLRPRPPWLLPAVVALTLLLAGGATTGLLNYAAAQATQPIAAVRLYCAALRTQNYAAAYVLTAATTQQQVSKTQFRIEAQLRDGMDGKVTRCAPVPAARDPFGDATGDLAFLAGRARSAAVTVTIVRARLGTRIGAITMARQGGSWVVELLAAALQGAPLGPLLLADHFCQALATNDFKTAFADLSAHQVTLEQSEANFAREVAPPAGSKYTGCVPDFTTYRVAGTTASVRLALTIQVTTPSGASVMPVAALASFVQEKGVWKLDGLDLPSPAS